MEKENIYIYIIRKGGVNINVSNCKSQVVHLIESKTQTKSKTIDTAIVVGNVGCNYYVRVLIHSRRRRLFCLINLFERICGKRVSKSLNVL